MRQIKKGSADQSVVIRIVDSTDGTPETGVVYNTSGIDLWYRREGATKTSITEATLASLDAAHSDGGFLHIGDGYYRLDLPDAAVATGADGVMVGGTVTGMVVIGTYVPLVAYDPQDAADLGLSNLDGAISDLPTAAENADAVWDEARSGHTTTGTFGGDAVDAPTNFASMAIDASGKVTVGTNDDKTGYSLSATGVDAIWDEAQSGHTTAGTFGKYLDAAVSGVSTGGVSAADIADAVWDEALSGHATAGTAGAAVSDILTDTGTTLDGKLDTIDTNVDSILADTGTDGVIVATNNDKTGYGLADGALTAAKIGADAITAAKVAADVTTEIQSGLATSSALSTAQTAITAIKAKTDNLPASPAATGDIPSAATIATSVLTTAMTESYGSDGGTVTVAQALYELLAMQEEKSISGVTVTAKKRDGSTAAFTLTLNDSSAPTSITRAT